MIVSVEKAREFLDTELSDTQLEIKLSALERFIRNYTHNDFQIREIRSETAVADGRILTPPRYVHAGDTIQISQSLLNNGIYTVKDITDEGMTVSESLLDCMKNLVTKVCYPSDVIEGTLNMLKWQIENADKIGIQSEKLSRYSVTYFNIYDNCLGGYPKTVTGFLVPYMKARF